VAGGEVDGDGTGAFFLEGTVRHPGDLPVESRVAGALGHHLWGAAGERHNLGHGRFGASSEDLGRAVGRAGEGDGLVVRGDRRPAVGGVPERELADGAFFQVVEVEMRFVGVAERGRRGEDPDDVAAVGGHAVLAVGL
jgi:hypothetical protein